MRLQLGPAIVIFRRLGRARDIVEAPVCFIAAASFLPAAFAALAGGWALIASFGSVPSFADGQLTCRGGQRSLTDDAIAKQTHRMIERIIHALQQRIVRQHGLQLLMQFQRGQLQQTNGLLQLRGQRQMLRYAKL